MKCLKLIQGTVGFGLLQEGRILAPRIRQGLYKLPFGDVTFLKTIFCNLQELGIEVGFTSRLGRAFYLRCLPIFDFKFLPPKTC